LTGISVTDLLHWASRATTLYVAVTGLLQHTLAVTAGHRCAAATLYRSVAARIFSI